MNNNGPIPSPERAPRVSVIVPTYNRAALLCETLDSVFAQTFRDYELIVVDDGSTDETPERLRARGTRVQVERTGHAGEGAARNAGLERARGEYVAFLDADDLWDARFLDRMTRALDAAPGADFVYCDYGLFDAQGEIIRAYLPAAHKRTGELFDALLRADFLCVGGVLLRRARCATLRFDPALPVAADWDFWLRLARMSRATFVDEPLLRVRVHPASASRDPARLYPCNLTVLDKLRRDFPDEARRYRPLLSRQTSNFHRALARYYGSRRQPLAALQQVALAAVTRFL